MTYIELIVVLGIWTVMSAIVIYNYTKFQAKVEIKNLASDIALKIVEAQRSALSGNLQIEFLDNSNPDIKPSYGVYFDVVEDEKKLIYFADLNNVNGYNEGEELDFITIEKGSFIENIDICSVSSETCKSGSNSIDSLAVVFKRPDSSAIFSDSNITSAEYAQITIKSENKEAEASIKVYKSGRIQVD